MSSGVDRVLTSTRHRLEAVTFGLVALLVVGIGMTATIATLRALDDDVDRALAASVAGALAALEGELPHDSGESDESPPAAADTFILDLAPDGTVAANPSRVAVPGLPDQAAVAVARATGRDLRTVSSQGTSVRLLTVPITDGGSGAPVGFVQGGFVLTLHDEQSASLVAVIAIVCLLGLVAAGIVTLVVTGRALAPIRRSFESQRRFVADASHELRTPAALIRANAEVLEREGLVSSDGHTLVDDIVAESGRLGRLVGDLLALASAETNREPIEMQPLDLAAVAVDTGREMSTLAARRDVTIDCQAPAPLTVLGDRDQIVQLMTIMLDNAIDHSPSGARITVTVQRAGGLAEVAVADTGPGVAAADRERIFEPFARMPGVQRDRAGGTGLGLAIARRIVEAHGGTIEADAAWTAGARFVVRLPVAS